MPFRVEGRRRRIEEKVITCARDTADHGDVRSSARARLRSGRSLRDRESDLKRNDRNSGSNHAHNLAPLRCLAKAPVFRAHDSRVVGAASSQLPAHCLLYSLTSSANVTRFSDFRRSGAQSGTSEPGAPVLPPGGVTPPSPEKYGTFAARWLNSARNVTN